MLVMQRNCGAYRVYRPNSPLSIGRYVCSLSVNVLSGGARHRSGNPPMYRAGLPSVYLLTVLAIGRHWAG